MSGRAGLVDAECFITCKQKQQQVEWEHVTFFSRSSILMNVLSIRIRSVRSVLQFTYKCYCQCSRTRQDTYLENDLRRGEHDERREWNTQKYVDCTCALRMQVISFVVCMPLVAFPWFCKCSRVNVFCRCSHHFVHTFHLHFACVLHKYRKQNTPNLSSPTRWCLNEEKRNKNCDDTMFVPINTLMNSLKFLTFTNRKVDQRQMLLAWRTMLHIKWRF